MTTHPGNPNGHDQISAALTAMLHHAASDIQPRPDAVTTIIDGVRHARRRRYGYTATALAVAAAITGGVLILTPDHPNPAPVITPTTTTSTPTPTTPSQTPSPTDTTTIPTVPTSTPTTPTDAPTPDPLILSPDGISNIHIGMSVSDAYATGTLNGRSQAVASPFPLPPYDGQPVPDSCADYGTATHVAPDQSAVWMDDTHGVLDILVTHQHSAVPIATIDGLYLGDPLDRITEIYPDAEYEPGPPGDVWFIGSWHGEGVDLIIEPEWGGGDFVGEMHVRVIGQYGCYS